ncbi:S41 family peptidase [Microbulbifer epialgicus]|uniref:S41 family peptidase n=1 Tax=Microbulbifer epialgicus TaxID=393907 RepID=A0ABV4P4A0_9GAMM
MRSIRFLLKFVAASWTFSTATALPESDIDDWIEDIDYFQQELQKKHINLYHSISEKQLTEELSRLKSDLPSLSENQLLVEMMRISRLIDDGHTQVAFWEEDIGFFPFRFATFAGELRLVTVSEAHRHLLGYKLKAINDTPIEEVMRRLSPVVQGVENAHSLKVRLATQVKVAQILDGIGITDGTERANYTFTNDAGNSKTASVSPVSMEKFSKQLTHRIFPKQIPFGSKSIVDSENLWMSANEEVQTAYIYFRRYPSFSDMEDFSKDIEDFLERKNIKNLIIDFRENGGGDFFVGLGMAWRLVLVDSLDWDHGIYTLISNKTYSAAMSNAAQYRQLLNAKLVGEPTGGNPVGYQDMGQFSLPNSEWTITYSKRNYKFQDAFTEGVQPDVLIEPDWQSYQQGVDRPLSWILEDIKKRM